MSFNYRFEPPTNTEPVDVECPYTKKCNEYDCEECKYEGSENMNEAIENKVIEIITKFLNIEIISIDEPAHNATTFDLYDYLDKPGNFDHDVKLAAKEIKAAFPDHNVETKFYNDSYWNGEEQVETYNCLLGILQ